MEERLYQLWMWILTVVVVPLLSFLTLGYFGLRERVKVLEQVKTVDPAKIAEVIASLTASMNYMSSQMKEMKEESKAERQEMKDLLESIQRQRNNNNQ